MKNKHDNLPAECPICRKVFPTGITGWYSHIASDPSKHPTWHPDILDQQQRKLLFMKEFPEFFGNARTPSRRYGAKQMLHLVQGPSTPPPAPPSVGTPSTPPAARFCHQCGAELFPTFKPQK